MESSTPELGAPGDQLDGASSELDELRAALEELRLARKEIELRDEELLASRHLVELERRRYWDLFDLAPVGYLVTDLEGVVLEANRAAGELLGKDSTLLVGESLAALVGPERRPAFRSLVREAGAGARWYDEVPFLTPGEGRTRLLVQAMGTGPGTTHSIRWSLAESNADVGAGSPSSELASARRLQRHRLSALLDRVHYCVVTVDRSLRVTYANSAAARLLAEGGDLVGSPLVDPWPEPSLSMLAARMFEHRAAPEEKLVSLDDRRAYEVLTLPPDASGEALVVIADVTANERRQRAEREFVANAAHQLRTPVSAIASAIEVLQGGAKDDPVARDRFLAHLDRQCTRLVGLTRALLLLARAQALEEPPRIEIVPLRPLLDELAQGLHPAEGVDVRVDCPIDLAALGNRDLLDQAIGNLAENAARFTVEGEIVLSADPCPDDRVCVAVVDTGPGSEFPSDGSFHRFYRDPAALGEGFGLGLAIAAEAMRVLGGELKMESTADGTRATATLPAATVRRR